MAIQTINNGESGSAVRSKLNSNFSELAASASSVVQQDLSGINAAALHRSPNAVTAMFVYDTSKDSDGGAWTEKCQHTSWYNEPINGKWLGSQASEAAARAVSGAATGDYFQRTTDGLFYSLNATSGITQTFRGNKRDFPRLAAIVAEASSVTIYDLTEPGRPMAFRFVATATATITAKNLLSGANSLAAINGRIFVGGTGTNLTGLTTIDFASDRARLRLTSGYSWATGIATRNTAGGYQAIDASVGGIVNAAVNAASATVLPDAPIDPVTGLKVPTIAVATAGGISVIKHNGTVVNSSTTVNYGRVTLNKAILAAQSGNSTTWDYFLAPGSLGASFAASGIIFSGGNIPDFSQSATSIMVSPARNLFVKPNGNQVRLLNHNEATRVKGTAATITNTFNTGHQTGDIRRTYLADVGAGSVTTGPELVVNGTFDTDTDWTKGTGWTIVGGKAVGSSVPVGQLLLPTANISVVVGKAYQAAWKIDSVTAGALQLLVFDGSTNYPGAQIIVAAGEYRLVFTATTTIAKIYVGASSSAFSGVLDDFSVTEVVADRSYKARGATITGTLVKSEVSAAAQLVAYSGFSAANYAREPYHADLDFGTGEWTASAWVNVPVTLPLSSLPVVGSNLWAAFSTNWSTQNGATIAGSDVSLPTASQSYVFTTNNLAAGKSYLVELTLSGSGTVIAGAYTSQRTFGSMNNAITLSATPTTYSVYCAFLPGESDLRVGFGRVNGGTATSVTVGAVSLKELGAFALADRAHSSGPRIQFGVTGTGQITATAFDGTTTRTVTSTAAYNTATWLKARVNYTTDGTLAIRVNGVEAAATRGNPLLTLNNANAVLTIGNSFALDAPFPGSIALLKLSGTVPTAEQAAWMYEQEKHLFQAGAQCCLPDAGAIADLAYDEATDKWIAISATNESEWSGLVRTSVTAVPAGSYTRAAAGGGVQLLARSTTSPGVDVTIPAYGLREELVKRAESAARLNAQTATYDFVGGFTANTTTGNTAILTIANLTYPTRIQGAQVTGTGIPANATIADVSGTTGYLSAAATATGTAVAINLLDFALPTGMQATAVMVNGVVQREGPTAAYTRLFDGFREVIRFAVAPGNTAWVQIQTVRSAA